MPSWGHCLGQEPLCMQDSLCPGWHTALGGTSRSVHHCEDCRSLPHLGYCLDNSALPCYEMLPCFVHSYCPALPCPALPCPAFCDDYSTLILAISMQTALRALVLVSAVSAILASVTLDTYTAQTPKRLFIQHIIRDSNTAEPTSVYAAASSDATPISVALTEMNLTAAEMHGREWLVSHSRRVSVLLMPCFSCF